MSRQLGTLARLGLVEHTPVSGRYRLGVRILRLANAVLGRLNLRDVARPNLEELVHQVGETATLSIPGAQRCSSTNRSRNHHAGASVLPGSRASTTSRV